MNSAKRFILFLIAAFHLSVISNQAPITTTTTKQTSPNPVRQKVPPPEKDFSKIGSSEVSSNRRSLIGALADGQGVSASETFVDSGVSAYLDDGKTRIKRMIHKVGGYPVWNSGAVTLERDNEDVGFLAMPSTSGPTKVRVNAMSGGLGIVANNSRQACRQFLGDAVMGRITNITTNRFVYDKDTKSPGGLIYADLVEIRGYSDPDGVFFLKYCLVDTRDFSLIKWWNGINDAVPGGNIRIGKYNYAPGAKRPNLPTNMADDGRCELTSPDKKVRVYDMGGRFDRIDDLIKTNGISPFRYDCSYGPNDGDGRSYGPLADTFYNAVKVKQVMTNPDFGNLPMDKITPSGIIRAGVHLGKGVDNAFWDSESLYLGDGRFSFYALGTCLDVVSHEINHAVTQMSSGLIYTGEAGCLNEAFSDVMGEFAEFYVNGTNDFLVAASCMVEPANFLRNMSKPAKYSDYFPDPNPSVCSWNVSPEQCHDPHVCSAVPNYIFYKLATSPSWTTKEAGKAWLMANRLMWKQETNMHDAGCGVATIVQKNMIVNGDVSAVVKAWQAGGINIADCVSVPDDKTGQHNAKVLGGTYDNPKRIKNCVYYDGITARRGQELYYVIKAPSDATYVYTLIYGDNGDADLYIAIGNPPTQSSYKWAPYYTGSDEWIVENIQRTGVDYYIMIHAVDAFKDLQLYACFSS